MTALTQEEGLALSRRTPEQAAIPGARRRPVLGRREPDLRDGARRPGGGGADAGADVAAGAAGGAQRGGGAPPRPATTPARNRPPSRCRISTPWCSGRCTGSWPRPWRRLPRPGSILIRSNRRLFGAARCAVGRTPRAGAEADRDAGIDAAGDLARAARRVRPGADGDGADARPGRPAGARRVGAAQRPAGDRRGRPGGARQRPGTVADAPPVDSGGAWSGEHDRLVPVDRRAAAGPPCDLRTFRHRGAGGRHDRHSRLPSAAGGHRATSPGTPASTRRPCGCTAATPFSISRSRIMAGAWPSRRPAAASASSP